MVRGPGILSYGPYDGYLLVESINELEEKCKETLAASREVKQCKCLCCKKAFTNIQVEKKICKKCFGTTKAERVCPHERICWIQFGGGWCEDCGDDNFY